jgi:hypothetical protein
MLKDANIIRAASCPFPPLSEYARRADSSIRSNRHSLSRQFRFISRVYHSVLPCAFCRAGDPNALPRLRRHSRSVPVHVIAQYPRVGRLSCP